MLSADFGAAGCWARPILKVRAAVHVAIAFCSRNCRLDVARSVAAVVRFYYSARNVLSQVDEDGLLLKRWLAGGSSRAESALRVPFVVGIASLLMLLELCLPPPASLFLLRLWSMSG
jgi:hypothetical protein